MGLRAAVDVPEQRAATDADAVCGRVDDHVVDRAQIDDEGSYVKCKALRD